MSGDGIEPGVILQAINDIFSLIETVPEREYLLRVSYMEICNEVISDLLANSPTTLKIKETSTGEVYVDGLKEEVVSTPDDVLELLRQGQEKRQVGETCMNRYSSRSHAIFRMIIESKLCDSGNEGAVQVSHLNFVDLAGSEKAGQMGTTGHTFQESVQINKSLFSLGTVIKTLSEGKKAFYRNSKLTRILQNSLGGNARTAIICNATPTSVDQTLSTLMFARRAKDICNKPKVNEVMSDQARLRSHKRKIQELEKELKCLKSDRAKEEVEKELERKDKRIQELEQLAKNLNANVLVSSLTPRMIMRKQRRETWGGHIEGFGGCAAPSVVSANFNLSNRLNSHSQLNLQAGASPPLRRTSSIIDQIIDAFNQSNADLTNVSTRPKISECVPFRMQSLATDFSSNAAALESRISNLESQLKDSNVTRENLEIEISRLKLQHSELEKSKVALEKDFEQTRIFEQKFEEERRLCSQLRKDLDESRPPLTTTVTPTDQSTQTDEPLEEISNEFVPSSTELLLNFDDSRVLDHSKDVATIFCLEKSKVDLLATQNETLILKESELESKIGEFEKLVAELQSELEKRELVCCELRQTVSDLEKSKVDLLATRNETFIVKESELESKIGQLEEGLLDSNSRLENALDSKNKFEKMVEELQTEIERRQSICEELRQTVSNLENELESKRNSICRESLRAKEQFEIEMTESRNRLSALNSQVENASEAKSELETRVAELEAENESCLAAMTKLEDELRQNEKARDEFRATIEFLEEQTRDLESQLENVTKSRVETQNETEWRKRVDQLSLELERQSRAKEALEKRAEELELGVETLRQSHQDQLRLESDKVANLENELEKLSIGKEESNEELREITSRLNELEIAKERSDHQLSEKSAQLRELRLEKERGDEKVRELTSRLCELETSEIKLAETLSQLDALRQSKIQADRAHAVTLAQLEELKSSDEERREMSFQLRELRQSNSLSEGKLGETLRELDELRRLNEERETRLLETLSQLEVINKSKEMLERELAETLPLLDELRQFKQQSDQELVETSELEELRQFKIKMEEKLAATLSELDQLRQLKQQSDELSSQLEEARRLNVESEEKLATTLSELDQLQQMKRQSDDELNEKSSQLEEQRRLNLHLEEKLATTLSQLDKLQRLKLKSDEELCQVSLQLQELRRLIEQSEEKLATTLSQLEELRELKQQSDELSSQLEGARRLNVESEEKLITTLSQLEELQRLKRQSDDDLNEKSSQLQDLQRLFEQSEEKLATTLTELEALQQLKHQSDEELRELSSQLEQVRQLKRQSDEELCEASSQLEQERQMKIQSEEKLVETIEKCESLKYEIECYEVRVDVLSEEKLRDDQVISQLRDKIQKLNDKEASSATTTPQNETSDKDQLVEELKFQLEEEKLKFAEFWEDTNQQQLADSEEMAKRCEEIRELEANIESLKQHIRDLTNENVSLNDKLSKLDSKISEKAAASSHLDHDDESRVKEVEILSSKLSEERAKRYKAETKLANEIKRCESLKRDRKQYEEKIYHLTNQLRKNQTALDETIRRDREEPGSSATMKGDASHSKVVCNVESNIGSLQVFEAQRQLYELHKHCKKIEEENTLLRNKYKELKKRLSHLSSTNDKENISTSSDRSGDSLTKTTRATTTTTTTTLMEDDPNSDHFLKAKNQSPLLVGEALEPSPKSIADFIPASFAEPPTTPTKKFTTIPDNEFDFTLSTLPNETSPKKSANECPTQ